MTRQRPVAASLRGLGLACASLGLLAAAPAPVLAQTVAEPGYDYTTRRGDTVIGIGQRLLSGPSVWREVARFNGLKDPDRIAIGATLRIPLRLLRSEAGLARLEQVVGDVRSGGSASSAARRDEMLPEGATLQTGPDGYALLRLADGSLLRLAADSRLQIDRARRYPSVDHVSSGVQLERGRVEVKAARSVAGKPGFEVRTPQGVLGVRGTEFRVSVSDGEQRRTAGEVLEGVVQFDGGDSARKLGAGFGTLIDARRRVTEPTPLLAAPDLAALPALQQRLVLRFALPAQAGATGFRGQIARDAQMRELLADTLAEAGALRFAGLADGDYVLRVRAIDERGLEGRDAWLPFRLKARPEPPLPAAPAPRGVTRGTRVELSWASHPEATGYRLQVARDAAFTGIVRELAATATTRQVLEDLPAGDYYWRLASVRGTSDQGPWGDVRSFVMRPPLPIPAAPAIGDTSLRFSWAGEPGQTFEFQLASDERFEQVLLDRRLERAEFDWPRPAGGLYFMRLRARDADGFLGPFTTPQRFAIEACLRAGDGACVRSGAGSPVRLP